MDYVSQCVSCGSRNLWRYPAVIAPFLAARVESLRNAQAHLMWFSHCGVAFFNPRLSGEEMGALYRDYRSSEYQALRQRCEPDYTPEINAMVGTGEVEVRNRKAHMRSFLTKHLDFSAIQRVLDYGGDRGQYILDDFSAAKRVVYEISGVDPIPGITAVSSWSEVSATEYDLVLCNHVLEHIPYPGSLLTELSKIAHRNTMFYFEVPLESPFKSRYSIKHWLRRLGLRFLPRITEPMLRHTGKVPFLMHEHINKFSMGALGRLLSENGYTVLALEESSIDVGWARVRIISCLARSI